MTNAITKLFVEDIQSKLVTAQDKGTGFVRLPTSHLAALLELLVELELAAGQASRPKPGSIVAPPLPPGTMYFNGSPVG